jgi:hypothetical protein
LRGGEIREGWQTPFPAECPVLSGFVSEDLLSHEFLLVEHRNGLLGFPAGGHFNEDGFDTFGEVAVDTQGKTEQLAPIPIEPKAAPHQQKRPKNSFLLAGFCPEGILQH